MKHKNRQSELRSCDRRGDHGLTTEDWQTLEREVPSALKAGEEKDRVFDAKAKYSRQLKDLEEWVERHPKKPINFDMTRWIRKRFANIEDPELRKAIKGREEEVLTAIVIGMATGKRRILS